MGVRYKVIAVNDDAVFVQLISIVVDLLTGFGDVADIAGGVVDRVVSVSAERDSVAVVREVVADRIALALLDVLRFNEIRVYHKEPGGIFGDLRARGVELYRSTAVGGEDIPNSQRLRHAAVVVVVNRTSRAVASPAGNLIASLFRQLKHTAEAGLVGSIIAVGVAPYHGAFLVRICKRLSVSSGLYAHAPYIGCVVCIVLVGELILIQIVFYAILCVDKY